MPGRDGTGPLGAGTMTGRGMGLCAANIPANTGMGAGMGLGRRLGCGLGYGRGYGRGRGMKGGFGAGAQLQPGAVIDRTEQIVRLRQQAEQLEGSLQAVQERLAALEETAE